jgi:hypothetical protein
VNECPICNRISLNGEEFCRYQFCRYHHAALEELRNGFEGWSKALELDWKRYLLRVYEIEGLGRWVHEIIDYIMQQEST